jgi:molybdopterin-guanine dinucleotide biosynthesis protein A
MNSNQVKHEATSIIRVLITNLTGMIATIVEEAIQQQADIELLGNVEGLTDVMAAIAEADVLVQGVDNVYSPPESCLQILSDYPNLKILVLATSDDQAIAYWRALYCQQIQIVSSQTLIASIRQIHSLSPF